MGELLTVKEAAAYLRLSPLTIHRHLNAGILKGAKHGQQWRIKREDLDKPSAGELTPQEQLRLLAEVTAEAEAKTPESSLLPLPEGYEALRGKVWRALGYPDGYTWENYVEHTQKHGRDAFRLERQQERLLPVEEQELLVEGIRIESENVHHKAIALFAVDAKIQIALRQKGYRLTPRFENPEAYITGEGLLAPIDKAEKEELEGASAVRPPRTPS
jgi:excisionase family DNA binding protein